MISKETLTVGILAVAAGLIGAYGLRSYMSTAKASPVQLEKKPATMKIPVAVCDLPADRVVAAGDIALMSMTREALQKRNLPLAETMMTPTQIIGRRLQSPVKQGAPFLTSGLYLAGTGPRLSAKLKAGFRAVSLWIPTGRIAGVSAGSVVDLLFRSQPRPAGDGVTAIPEMTVTLLSNVEILDVEQGTKGGQTEESLVTLAVPAEKVAAVQAVEGRGEFSLALRPESSTAAVLELTSAETQMTLEDVLGIEPPAPPPQPFRTVIYRRGSPQVNEFVDNQLVSTTGGGVGGCKSCKKKSNVVPAGGGPVPDPNLSGPSASSPSGGGIPTLAPPRSAISGAAKAGAN